ncbi:glutamate-1-semialdehyde 2,1-aminomutase [Candidatus Koribacter versatilis Ellin345]|uniref:Glutamate-1-semialdehyde 2,1-aminomutase n=1 Tax=Koribacter versatilis (strain Ellin345) TaxID=204669 RepID=Q1IRG1_KORVE|nr:glutamate-1-semialdehyde 2,1-aminomutase [Candidatus Koribacter versatilis]ABF40539.1 glutamate-1-semialdehyde 2,1-aminomutase [Candidatus Koribacter versatilis Ellin345]
MHDALRQEIELFEKRTPKSAEAHKRNLKRLPLGVASNYRAYDPYPIFVKDAFGSKFRDLDGNEYIDHNLTFGALMAGHCHPAVMKAVEKRLTTGTMFGMPHDMEWELAEEICARFPIEMLRFASTGTEATMHTVRLCRAATGRDKIIKFEGGYHGLHDAALVSVKPKLEQIGDLKAPIAVPGGQGVPKTAVANVLIASFNDLESVEHRFKTHPNEISAIILEPVMMNVGICMPEPGFLEGLRELCDKHGALLIFDEVKTGAKLGWGGASEYFGVIPDAICLAKSIGGGLPLAAFGASKKVMGLISDHKVFHGGTYNTNPVSMAAGLATFREVLTRENYAHVEKLSHKLVTGYRRVVEEVGLDAYLEIAGANGVLMFAPKRVRNYRDWLEVDASLWQQYWFAMVNRGVMPQPYWWDEQWTMSVAHTDADTEKHLAVFGEIAPALAVAQKEPREAVVH